MRSQIIFILILSLIACDQAPTTLDEEAFISEAEALVFSSRIETFDFDMLTWSFFFAITATSPEDSLYVEAQLWAGSEQIIATFTLQDIGLGNDILANDGLINGSWTLPDSLSNYIDSLWTLDIQTFAGQEMKADTQSFYPERPVAPIISEVSHSDTLILPQRDQILDQLKVKITHPGGRDKIRDVSFTVLKPDSSMANGGVAFQLYDDGGAIGYSGDDQAGDNIYSLIISLNSENLIGTYYWTFNAKTWLGIEAEPFEDSLVVLPHSGLSKADHNNAILQGVFQ